MDDTYSWNNLSAKEKIKRARIQLQDNNPFFSYLTHHLKITESEEIPTAAVDPHGRLKYNSEWIDELDEGEVTGVLAHEVLHVALEHLIRRGSRQHKLWNIAVDIVVNNMVLDNGFEIPSDEEVGEAVVDRDRSGDSAEEIYADLLDDAKQVNVSIKDGDGENGFDVHIEGEDISDEEKKEIKEEWKDKLSNAAQRAKMKGNAPAGMERIVDTYLNSSYDWKSLLNKYVTNNIIQDFTWKRPNKKSDAFGFYMPDVRKEKLDVIVAIDTSGSIGQKMLNSFASEMIGINNSFNQVEMTVIVADAEVQETYTLKGNEEEIRNMSFSGGGGTSHVPVFRWAEENVDNARVMIAFTDGYTEFPSDTTIDNTIWCVPEYGANEEHFPDDDIVVKIPDMGDR